MATADLPGSTPSGRLTPIPTPLRVARPTCPPDCTSWVREVTRAGPWAQGIDSSFEALLRSGLLLSPPRVDPKQNGVFPLLGNPRPFMWLAQGWALGLSWRRDPGASPALLEPPAGQTANVTQTTTHRDTPLHVGIRQQGTRRGSRSCARTVSQSGRVSGGKQLGSKGQGPPSLPREKHRTGGDSEEAGGRRRRTGRRWEMLAVG